MRIRLDYFPRARKIRTRPEPTHRDLGTLRCEICHQTAPRHTANQKLCGRLECKTERDRLVWQIKGKRWRSTKQRNKKAVIEPLPPPRCETCGNDVKFGSDPMMGVSIVWCSRCGEKPLQRWGTISYGSSDLREAS